MINYCRFSGIGLIPWGPLNAGQLARPLSAESTTRAESTKGTPFEQKPKEWENEIVRRVEKLAGEKGWTMSQVAIAWSNSKVTSPIIGFSSVRMLRSCFLRGCSHVDTGEAYGGGHYPGVHADGSRDQDSRGAVPASEHSWPPVRGPIAAKQPMYLCCLELPVYLHSAVQSAQRVIMSFRAP
jgi:aryl-alcohol dehydrogenase-like predicted oxidoreductase